MQSARPMARSMTMQSSHAPRPLTFGGWGLGGYIVDGLTRLVPKKVKKWLTPTIPRTTTIHGPDHAADQAQRERDEKAMAVRRASWLAKGFRIDVSGNSHFVNMDDETLRYVYGVEYRALQLLFRIVLCVRWFFCHSFSSLTHSFHSTILAL